MNAAQSVADTVPCPSRDVAARATMLASLALVLAACGSAPTAPDGAASGAATSGAANPEAAAGSPQSGPAGTSGAPGASGTSGAAGTSGASGAAGVSGGTPGAAGGTAISPAQPAPVPARALADFNRAVNMMKAGQSGEAELEFKQLAVGYPQLVGAQVNLALLQRKANRLDDAEATLKAAVEKNPGSALAWTELGLTQRMKGRFQDAAASYDKAVAADPNYAPARRNYAVLLDLYLGDPERALTELERYKELTGEDKPVTGWIAELRQRTGKPAAPRPAEPRAPAEEAAPGTPAAPPAETPAQPAPETAAPRLGAGTAQANSERGSPFFKGV